MALTKQHQALRAPFPWYGGKSLAAPLIWRAFGNVPNYVEPFAGSMAVLLARPHEAKVETVNDKDGFYVRVCCGDWKRVMGRSTLGIDTEHGMTPCGVVLDPPYEHKRREKRLYREDTAELSKEVREWALENGDNPKLRIALCGWEGEHAMPPSWEKVEWRSNGTGKNRGLERIWFSPYCSPALRQASLFADLQPPTDIVEPELSEDDALRANLREMAAAFRGAS